VVAKKAKEELPSGLVKLLEEFSSSSDNLKHVVAKRRRGVVAKTFNKVHTLNMN